MALLPVAICTSEFIITGKLKFDQPRLIDYLNVTIESSISILDPGAKPLHGPQPNLPNQGLAMVPKRDIILAIPMETQEVLQRRSEQRFFAYQTKTPCRVFLNAPPYRIVGMMNLVPGTTIQNVIVGQSDEFLAITQVESITLSDASLPIPPVVVVNRARVAFVFGNTA